MSRTKVCARCSEEESVMFRVQHQPGKRGFFCASRAFSVKVDNPFYRLGGRGKASRG